MKRKLKKRKRNMKSVKSKEKIFEMRGNTNKGRKEEENRERGKNV